MRILASTRASSLTACKTHTPDKRGKGSPKWWVGYCAVHESLLTAVTATQLLHMSHCYIQLTVSPSLAAICSATHSKAFSVALPLPMLGFGSSMASNTASWLSKPFFWRICNSAIIINNFSNKMRTGFFPSYTSSRTCPRSSSAVRTLASAHDHVPHLPVSG